MFYWMTEYWNRLIPNWMAYYSTSWLLLTFLFAGNARSIVATANPMDGYTWEGFSLLYIPHQFAFHLSTTTKEWFLAISPSAYWSYYTFSWSEQNGIRSYENALLVMQDKESRSVNPIYRSHFYLNIAEIFTSIQMFRFMTRMKAWNRDLTANQIKEDFKKGKKCMWRHSHHCGVMLHSA